MTDLLATVAAHAEKAPDTPASLMLSPKVYDELARRIVVQPVTPLRVALLRLREVTEGNSGGD